MNFLITKINAKNAKINITTHSIEGLCENDFILAAKIDQIFNV